MKRIRHFLHACGGATAVEYGLIAALIGMTVIAGASAVGNAINHQFTVIQTTVTNAGA